MSLTSPLGLTRHLRKPDLRLEVIPWLNMGLLALMLYMLGSSYIWAPSLVIANNNPTPLPSTLRLPTLPAQPGGPALFSMPDAMLVITAPQYKVEVTKGKDGAPDTYGVVPATPAKFILPDGLHTEDELPAALKKLRKNLPDAKAVLLLKAEEDVPERTIIKVCAMAQAAGFDAEAWAYLPADAAGDNAAATSANGAASSP